MDYLRDYRDANIYKYFNLNFIEWINLPYNRARQMYTLGKRFFKEEIDIQEKSMENLKSDVKGNKT